MAIKIKPKTSMDVQQSIEGNPSLFDDWLDEIEQNRKESVLSAAKEFYSPIELYLYCRFLGYNGSILDLEQWFKQYYPKTDHRQMLLDEIKEMKIDIERLREAIENGSVKRDAGVARIAAMEKELRGTIAQVEQFTNNKDKRGLILAGADRVVRELLYIFKDDPIETALEEACMSAWMRINEEK